MATSNPIIQYHLHKQHPEKLQCEVYDLGTYRKKSGAPAAIPHSHSYYQIIWFFNEGGTHQIDFTTFAIKKNTVLFITKNQIHAFDDNEDVQGKLIHFNDSLFKPTEVDIFLKYTLFMRRERPEILLDFKIAIALSNYIGVIQEEMHNRNEFGYDEVVRFLLKSVLITIERAYRKQTDAKPVLSTNYEVQFFNFKELLENFYKKQHGVQFYADKLYISTKTLTSITKRIVQKTPSQIINDRLVLEAKRLLKFTPDHIAEIAFSIGFEDPSYFVKFFKRNTGVLPSQLRSNKR